MRAFVINLRSTLLQLEERQSAMEGSEDPPPITTPLEPSGAYDVPIRMDIDEAIDKLKKGRFQRRILAAAGMCNGVNAMAVMALSFIRNAIIIDFDISIDQSNWFESSVFFGILFGTLCFGPLGDEWGRKPVFLLSSTITAVGSLASAFAPNFQALVLLRFVVGIGVGGTVIPFDTLAELTPSRFRGAFLLYLGYFWTVGTSATPAIAAYAMMEKESWPLFLGLCSLPCFVSMVFGYLWVPESPRYLVEQNRKEEALEILREGARQNDQNPDKLYPPGTYIVTDEEEGGQEGAAVDSLSSLFSPQWRGMVICMLLVWTFLDFIYWGTIQAVTLVFAEFEGNMRQFDEGEQFEYDYGAIIGSSMSEVIGQTAVLLLIDRWGRVPTQALAYACGAIAVFCLCFVAWMEDTGTDTERFVLVLLAFSARMFIMAATSVTWVHTAEMLPTQIRNTAHAVADALAGTGGAFSPFLVAPDHSMLVIGIVMGGTTILTASLVWMLPETRGIALGKAMSSRANSPAITPSASFSDGKEASKAFTDATEDYSGDIEADQTASADSAKDVPADDLPSAPSAESWEELTKEETPSTEAASTEAAAQEKPTE